MNVNPITWKDAFSHKYVILCLICGGSLLILGLTFIVIYLILSSYTSSLHYFETIPTYIPAITLIINGIIVCILAKRNLRYFNLIKISGAFCLISALICVVTTVTTTVIHLNRLQTLQGCEYTSSSSTCICMTGSGITGSNDPSVQVTGHSSHYAFQNIPNCDAVHGTLNTCLRALFGVSVFGILISIFTSMLVYQLMSHEKKKKYLEQLESRRRFHQHAFNNRRNHDPLSPPPFPILSYPPPHTLAAQGCSAFMDDIFYPGGVMNGGSSSGRGGGWIWPPPPPPPWDLIDYRSYCTPSYESQTAPGPCSSSPGEVGPLGETITGHRSGLFSDTGRNNESTTSPETSSQRTLFSWLFNRNRRPRRQQRNTSRRLLSRDRNGHSIGSADCTGAMVTENRYNHRSPNRYGPLPPPHSPPPPPLSPTLPPPHHPLLPVGHFSPLLVPIHPSYRSVIRNRSLARLNRRTRSNDAIFHHLHSMAYAHPPPPPFFNGPPLLGSPQSLFASWGPPPPYSQPSSLENLATGQNNDPNNIGANNNESNNGNSSHGNNSESNSSHRVNGSSGNHGGHRRNNQINSVSNGLSGSDNYDNSSKLSTPISERRMLCNAFSSDGITLTIGGPVGATTPSKSSCIVEVHVQDDHHLNHDDVTSESKTMTFNTKEDELTSYHQHNNQQNHQSYKSLSSIPINLSNKQFSSHQQELTRSIDTIIYEQQNESNENDNFNCVINENYLGKVDETMLTNIDCKSTGRTDLFDTGSPTDCLQSTDLICVPQVMKTISSSIVIPNVDLSSTSTDSTSCNLTSSTSSSSGSHNLYSSSSLSNDSQSISQPIDQSLNENIKLTYERTTMIADNRTNETIDLEVNDNSKVNPKVTSYTVGTNGEISRSGRSNSITKNYMVTINDDDVDNDDDFGDLSNQPSSSNNDQSSKCLSSPTTTTNSLSTFNNKETNCPETGSHQGKAVGCDEKEIQEIQYMQTQSLPNLSYAAAVVVPYKTMTSPSHEMSSTSSSCQVTPQHGSKIGYQHPSSGNTSTSQDIADLELELDEEPLCFLPDLPYDGTQNLILNPNINDQSEQSITPHYYDISATKIKPPTPFANCPLTESTESSSTTSGSRTISDVIIAPDTTKPIEKQQSTPTAAGDNIIVTIRGIQV